MRAWILMLLLSSSLTAGSAAAKDRIKLGFISTMSGSSAELGQEQLDALRLALKHTGGTLGGLPVDVVIGDDEAKPDAGRQVADKLVQRDRIDVLTGLVYTNVVMALATPVLDAGVFIVSSNGQGPALAGKSCQPNFFVTQAQSATSSQAAAMAANKEGFKRAYLMSSNYEAGREHVEGFKRFYKGAIAGEAYTQFGQLDYAAEIAQARAAKPDVVYEFYSGGMGLAFLRQYGAAGMMKTAPLVGPASAFDPPSMLDAVGNSAAGAISAVHWHVNMDNPANKTFVADYNAAYGRPPSAYSANQYDAILLLDAAIKQVGGKIEDKDAFRAALVQAKFESVRGPSFAFNNNHFPKLDFYETKIVTNAQGKVVTELGPLLVTQLGDLYAAACPMK